MARSAGLRTRFAVSHRTQESDGWMDTADVWEDLGEVFAQEIFLRGTEKAVAAEINVHAQSKLRFRWSSDIDGIGAADKMTRIHDGKSYEIASVNNVDRRFVEVVVVSQ